MVGETYGSHHLYVPLLVTGQVLISVRDFDKNDAKAWWPVSALLVAVIYTGSKSLVSTSLAQLGDADIQQFLRIPVYTIFKNLTIILIVRVPPV
jgi:GDP-mannose transporter